MKCTKFLANLEGSWSFSNHPISLYARIGTKFWYLFTYHIHGASLIKVNKELMRLILGFSTLNTKYNNKKLCNGTKSLRVQTTYNCRLFLQISLWSKTRKKIVTAWILMWLEKYKQKYVIAYTLIIKNDNKKYE